MVDFAGTWRQLEDVGRDPVTGGYRRYAWSEAELACRRWFTGAAAERGLRVEADGNGNLFAWLGDPDAGNAVLTGSHFDSVPDGGGYDGPLGIVSAFLALDVLRDRGITPQRPIGVAAFVEEEGSRFGVACLGSRLLTGVMPGEQAAKLCDAHGVTLAEAMEAAGADPARLGERPAFLDGLRAYVELHIEQGRSLIRPVGVASGIWPHGRYRLEFDGTGNHAGTTRMADRCDPMLTYAYTVLAANKEARLRGSYATIARVETTPNATNAIPSRVVAWLDARAPEPSRLNGLVNGVHQRAAERASRDGTRVSLTPESVTPAVRFDADLRDTIVRVLDGVPVIPTGAGHDAGILAAQVPTAMLFVRNPSGVSHSPEEAATEADCVAGVQALADVLEELACR